MKADEFMIQLQRVNNSKELVDLLVQASIVAPPLLAPWYPQQGTKVAPLNNTPWVPAGTHGRVDRTSRAYSDGSGCYIIKWSTGKEEEIYKRQHDAYRLVYVY